jgi:AcrR family transcriptional regulator
VSRHRDGADLRRRLLSVTLDQLEATGDPSQVTVSSIVAAARCTPPSLYHYWPTRDALLAEASRAGWEDFVTSQQSSIAGVSDPVARLRARGRAYVEFARARPSLFRVLFMEPRPGHSPDADLAGLVGDVAQAMSSGTLRPGDAQLVALTIWAAVHGVAALASSHPDAPDALVDLLAHDTVEAMLAGLRGDPQRR